ncbi:MAG TPA: DUF2203 domain-containing protein [Bryobacteraceae bacterium]|jgi:hypothetical protein|nr:DUF2203 domain-containing protein [Bryobacteraceae bacterium]
MSRRFNLAEAQSLIPSVDALLREAISLKSEYQDAEEAMQAIAQRVGLMGGSMVNREHAIDARNRRDEARAKLRAAIEQVQEYGCVLKDLDTGLIDFPTLLRGEEVYLCWKLGEPAIAFWHGVNEGFRGRKAIDQDFLDHHRGDRAH